MKGSEEEKKVSYDQEEVKRESNEFASVSAASSSRKKRLLDEVLSEDEDEAVDLTRDQKALTQSLMKELDSYKVTKMQGAHK